MNIKKEDKVLVCAGKDKGKSGRVLKVYPEKNTIIVEGVNIIKRHTKPSQKNPQGGIIQKEAPISVSKVMVVDKKGNPTRVGKQIVLDDKTGKSKRIRISKKTGDML